MLHPQMQGWPGVRGVVSQGSYIQLGWHMIQYIPQRGVPRITVFGLLSYQIHTGVALKVLGEGPQTTRV
jgi:hypothetical protein